MSNFGKSSLIYMMLIDLLSFLIVEYDKTIFIQLYKFLSENESVRHVTTKRPLQFLSFKEGLYSNMNFATI